MPSHAHLMAGLHQAVTDGLVEQQEWERLISDKSNILQTLVLDLLTSFKILDSCFQQNCVESWTFHRKLTTAASNHDVIKDLEGFVKQERISSISNY